MNADLIAREAQQLLHEIAVYEEPRLFLDEVPSLAELYKLVRVESNKTAEEDRGSVGLKTSQPSRTQSRSDIKDIKGQITDKPLSGRREAILSVLRSKGPSYIKDISTVIRDVSEKTIQRELQALVMAGDVSRTGERRWTTYTLVS